MLLHLGTIPHPHSQDQLPQNSHPAQRQPRVPSAHFLLQLQAGVPLEVRPVSLRLHNVTLRLTAHLSLSK